MKYYLIFGITILLSFFGICNNHIYGQTYITGGNSYSKTFYVDGNSSKSITITIKPSTVQITGHYNNVIQYNINFTLSVTTTGLPTNSQINISSIAFTNSLNSVATAGTTNAFLNSNSSSSYPSSYSASKQTYNTPALTGYPFSGLTDQNMTNNTAVLPLAKYQAINIVFAVNDYVTQNSWTISGSTTTNTDLTTNNIVTPVTLSSFSAMANNNGVDIDWTTSTEINNAGFYLLHGTSSDNLTESSYITS